MKREIKYRAWKNGKMWLMNELLDPIDFEEVSYLCHILRNTERVDFSAKEWELMQFTGLKDKNGKEIYEGDILYCSDDPGSYHRIFWNNERCGWDDERLEDGDSNTSYYGFDMFMDCKVIGNIYENPELLK